MSKEEMLKTVVEQAVSNYQALEARSSFDEVIHESEVFDALEEHKVSEESRVSGVAIPVGSKEYYKQLDNGKREE